MTEPFRHQRRHEARLAAVQALYQMDVAGSPVNIVIEEFTEHRFGKGEDQQDADPDYFTDIVGGVVREQDKIDADISGHLSDKWSLKRLDRTLRALMRAGVYEISWRPDVPARVIVDEYVTLASDFFNQSEPGFVNGALDSYARSIRAAEYGPKAG